MASKAEIVNRAASRVGVSQLVQDVDSETTPLANQAKLHYEPTLQRLLRAYDWPFATRCLALALVSEAPTLDWAFAYRYPADCLKARRLVTGMRPAARALPPPAWQIASDASGRLIFTDQPEAVLEYTRRVDDPVQLDPLFAEAFRLALALEFGPALAKGTFGASLRQQIEREFDLAWSAAQAAAANEEQTDPAPESEFIRARY